MDELEGKREGGNDQIMISKIKEKRYTAEVGNQLLQILHGPLCVYEGCGSFREPVFIHHLSRGSTQGVYLPQQTIFTH